MDIDFTRYIPLLLKSFLFLSGGWLLTFFILYNGGIILSRMTLNSNLLRMDEDYRKENRINALYKLIIHSTAIFYYLSIPVIIFLFFAIWAVVIILSVSIMPLIIYLGLILWTFFPASLMIRSLILRKPKEDIPGELTREQNPHLWQLVCEVAMVMNIRPLDKIYLTPFNEFAVLERGSLISKLKNKGERILVLGMGLVNKMPENYFKSILAHEYGHFLDKDEFRIKTEEHIRSAINTLKVRFVEYRLDSWFNFIWLFLVLYTRLFNRVTHGIARLREFKADRIAAFHYGSETLREALRYTVVKNITFGRLLKEAFRCTRTPDPDSLDYLYTDPILPEDDESVLHCMKQKTGPFDSHPSINDRLKYLSFLHYPRHDDVSAPPLDSFQGHRKSMVRELIKNNFPLVWGENQGQLDGAHWYRFL